MTAGNDRPYIDALSLSSTDEQVHEAIATLEFTGQPTSRDAIAAVTLLDDPALDQALASLTERGLPARSDAGDTAEYAPRRRDWSAVPDNPEGPLAR